MVKNKKDLVEIIIDEDAVYELSKEYSQLISLRTFNFETKCPTILRLLHIAMRKKECKCENCAAFMEESDH